MTVRIQALRRSVVGGAAIVLGMALLVASPSSADQFPVDLGNLGDSGVQFENAGPYSAAAAAGDVNGDGYDDVIIGAQWVSNNSRISSGSSYVVYGGEKPIGLDLASLGSAGFRIDGAAAYDYSGGSVAGAGDINDDGYDDVLIGAAGADRPGGEDAGAGYLVFGSGKPVDIDLASLGDAGFRVLGAAAYDSAGWSVAGAADINADGYDDVLIGAPDASNKSRVGSGSTYVIYGTDTPADIDLASLGDAGFRIDGAAADDRAGWSVAGAGDINNDGHADALIGAPRADRPGATEVGASYLVYGTEQPTDIDLASLSDAGFRVLGAAAGDNSSRSVAGAGDVNNDGYADVLIGAPVADRPGATEVGASYLVYGTEQPTDIDLASLGDAGFRIDGAAAYDYSGQSVAGAGDINNDGYADVLIGAPYAEAPGAANAGAGYLVHGSAKPRTVDLTSVARVGFRIDGAAANDYSGQSVAGAGDVNGDGNPDLLVSAPGTDSGTAYLLLKPPPSYTVPAAPSGVSALPGGAQVDLTWTAPSDNGATITGYHIEASGGVGPWDIPATTSHTITGLTNGTAYQFRVCAINAAGTGPASAWSTAVTPRTLPAAPSGVSALPGDAQVDLTWTPPGDNGGATITGYRIESSGGVGPWDIPNTTSHTITGLTNGTSYQFRVCAINTAGTGPASAWSTAVTPQAPVTPPPPATPAATLTVTARKATKPVPKTGRVTLVKKVVVGPGQTSTIRVKVTPKKTSKKVTVKKTATRVKVRTSEAPKGAVRVTITASGTGVTPTTWTRTWKIH